MAGLLLATWIVVLSALGLGSAQANQPLSFDSCADLRQYLDGLEPQAEVRLAPATYECREPLNPAVDGLTIDFGGSIVRVADHALRPGILVGDLHTPPARRYKNITVRNVKVEGNRANQAFECWGGPCDPRRNDSPYWAQRLNGITINGCDDCVLIDVNIVDARSGGVVVVSSNRLLVDGLEAQGSHFDGLAGYWTRDSVFRNVRVHNNDYAGFSFDLDFSDNLIEDFESRDNRDHGMFIRLASGNSFVRGRFSDNHKSGVYFDRAHADHPGTCASDTRFEAVTVRGSGHYGAWLNFACQGNRFESSQLVDNALGCFGGQEAALIGQSEGTACIGPQPEQTVEAETRPEPS
jgi:Right handed beta helix region